MSHDSDATSSATRPLSHVPEARAHDITVSHWSGHQRKWRHAADADAPSATAASSGARVSHEDNAAGREGHAVRFAWKAPQEFRGRSCNVFPFPYTAASLFTRPRRGSTPTLPTAPSIPKSSQVSSNKNQVGRHLSSLPRLLYLMLNCSYRPFTSYADEEVCRSGCVHS